jgi:hypothetical protein
MTDAEHERRRINDEARAYRLGVRRSMKEFAKNLERERAILDEAERSSAGEFDADIKNARKLYDEGEREFYEAADLALRQFNAAVRRSRRSAS